MIIKSSRSSSEQGAKTSKCIVMRHAAEKNEVVLGIFVVRIFRILRGGRVKSREVVLDLLTVEQSVVVLEVVVTGSWPGLGKRNVNLSVTSSK